MQKQQLMQDVYSPRSQTPDDRQTRGGGAFRSLVHQLIHVCHINESHLTGLHENPISVAASVADSGMAVPPRVPNATVSSDRKRQVCQRPGCDTAVPTGCCVCRFARPIVPAPGVESVDKEQGIRIVRVAIEGVRPESHQSAPAVFANLIATSCS